MRAGLIAEEKMFVNPSEADDAVCELLYISVKLANTSQTSMPQCVKNTLSLCELRRSCSSKQVCFNIRTQFGPCYTIIVVVL